MCQAKRKPHIPGPETAVVCGPSGETAKKKSEAPVEGSFIHTHDDPRDAPVIRLA